MKDVTEARPFEELLHSLTVAYITLNEAHVRQFRGSIIVGHTVCPDDIPPLSLEKSYQVSSDESGCASHQCRVACSGSHSVAPPQVEGETGLPLVPQGAVVDPDCVHEPSGGTPPGSPACVQSVARWLEMMRPACPYEGAGNNNDIEIRGNK